MRAVIQRVKYAKLEIEDRLYSEINYGFLVLLGISSCDEEKQAEILSDKIAKLRIFEDENEKMNLSLLDFQNCEKKYSVLVVSNFTLYGDCKGQNRPYFAKAARPEKAEPLYELFCQKLRNKYNFNVQTGVFGADMQVKIQNDGPVTLIMDTDEL